VRLQYKRHALDGGGIGAFASLHEALLDQFLRIGKQGDALAGGALAAEIVGQAFAIGGLRKHTRESEFAHSARSCEKQSMWDTLGTEGATQRAYEPFVAKKLGKPHTLSFLSGRS
jgi:hypothetical protein